MTLHEPPEANDTAICPTCPINTERPSCFAVLNVDDEWEAHHAGRIAAVADAKRMDREAIEAGEWTEDENATEGYRVFAVVQHYRQVWPVEEDE